MGAGAAPARTRRARGRVRARARARGGAARDPASASTTSAPRRPRCPLILSHNIQHQTGHAYNNIANVNIGQEYRTLTGGGVQALVEVLQLHLVVVDPEVRRLDPRRGGRLLVRAAISSALFN